MYELGKRIKERRESLNMTQEELAYKMGYKTKSTITRIENGDNDIPSAKIKKCLILVLFLIYVFKK